MAIYSGKGYEIFTPMGNHKADFVAIKGTEIIRVQVKTEAKRVYKAKGTKYALADITTKVDGVKAPYSPTDIDEFCVVGKKRAWRIPCSEVYPRTIVMLSSTEEGYQPRHGLNVENWKVSL